MGLGVSQLLEGCPFHLLVVVKFLESGKCLWAGSHCTGCEAKLPGKKLTVQER